MSNHWLQCRLFTCLGCGERLLHDKMHGHVSFACSARPVVKPNVRPVFIGKTYEPKAGR